MGFTCFLMPPGTSYMSTENKPGLSARAAAVKSAPQWPRPMHGFGLHSSVALGIETQSIFLMPLTDFAKALHGFRFESEKFSSDEKESVKSVGHSSLHTLRVDVNPCPWAQLSSVLLPY
jgi:hypothetical protein